MESLQAETRAEFAERSVTKLEKSIDDLEGKILSFVFNLVLMLKTDLAVHFANPSASSWIYFFALAHSSCLSFEVSILWLLNSWT